MKRERQKRKEEARIHLKLVHRRQCPRREGVRI
jgi:hypothetical protein